MMDLLRYLPPLAGLLGPIHLISYSTLLGTELYQTFVNTKVCYKALPRTAFTTLQKRVFPVYFCGQTLLLLLTAVTVPANGPFSLIANKANWIPFAIAGATALLNLIAYGPRTQRIMVERIHQETRDKRIFNDITTPSAEMRKLNKSFSRNHAMSVSGSLSPKFFTSFLRPVADSHPRQR
ncbi:hypothetical protein DL766_001549 [Monosporascus sp. MC13-8B]|uniref:TMEM205-like domain-containing protein n=1 Tax=Monosporascus cannonballus TaxID=155416 RepID=A0ABY0GY46_9PEZI|nr:hypothetical protein DL762_007817 [Monosporascus cannonballus]RYO90751.1 hypothetical protein DL763_005220 [Monosporascus cannonballus]RYP37398.1 hypothetical protein DL766_001549 [Monosporascus sp. MC13-8B]